MGRNKIQNREDVLSKLISIRVTETYYKHLENLKENSDCTCVGEVARKVLLGKKIVMVHKDISMNGPMEELSGIRKELRAIGVNINQITHGFHISDTDNQRIFHAMKAAGKYEEVGKKVDALLITISKLAEKWLQ